MKWTLRIATFIFVLALGVSTAPSAQAIGDGEQDSSYRNSNKKKENIFKGYRIYSNPAEILLLAPDTPEVKAEKRENTYIDGSRNTMGVVVRDNPNDEYFYARLPVYDLYDESKNCLRKQKVIHR
jgi:hypothetical protein